MRNRPGNLTSEELSGTFDQSLCTEEVGTHKASLIGELPYVVLQFLRRNFTRQFEGTSRTLKEALLIESYKTFVGLILTYRDR